MLQGAVRGWEDGGDGGTAGWARVIGLPIWVECAAAVCLGPFAPYPAG